jgi:hypothetical protein
LLLSSLLDGELDPREAELARELLAEDPGAQEWFEATAALGDVAREAWDESDSLPRVAADSAPACADLSFVRANGTRYRPRRSPRDGSTET